MPIRTLERSEVDSVWAIDRSEVVDAVYRLEDGELVLKPEHYDMTGWPPGERELYGPTLASCFDRGGTFYGAFDDTGGLIGVAVLECRFTGCMKDQLQLTFLYVGRPHRGQGLGSKLFRMAAERARELGARKLYISSTPSRHTVDFYLHLGCRLAEELDPVLYELEPEDIHLEYTVP